MKTRYLTHSGFSLVEVTIALAVATFCLIVILGMLPLGLSHNQTSIRQTVAASLASGIISDLRATPTGTASAIYSIPIPTPAAGTTRYLKPDATTAAAVSGDDYCVTLVISAPATPQKTAASVNLLITWPAVARVSPPEYAGSYEVSTALDRN